MNWYRFAIFKNNATIIKSFSSCISDIAYIKTQNRQIVTTSAKILLKFEPMIKKTISEKSCILHCYYFNRISSFAYASSMVKQHL